MKPAAAGSPVPAASATASRSALILAFSTIYLVWGSTYLGMRVAVETMPPFLMAAVRFTIAGLLLFAYLAFRGAQRPTSRQIWLNAVIGTFLLLGGNGLVAWSEQFLPSGVTAVLIGISPLFFVLIEWAWPGGLRPSSVTLAAMLVGFGGVAWLAAPWESSDHGRLNSGGVLAILCGCVSWSLGSIYSRHAKHGAEPPMAAALQMLGGGAVLFLTSALHGDFAHLHLAGISGRSWVALAYLIAVGSLVGFSTYVWLVKHAPPARVATYAYVNPVVAVFLGWLALDEPITSRTLIASAVIVVAVAIITTQKAKTKS